MKRCSSITWRMPAASRPLIGWSSTNRLRTSGSSSLYRWTNRVNPKCGELCFQRPPFIKALEKSWWRLIWISIPRTWTRWCGPCVTVCGRTWMYRSREVLKRDMHLRFLCPMLPHFTIRQTNLLCSSMQFWRNLIRLSPCPKRSTWKTQSAYGRS